MVFYRGQSDNFGNVIKGFEKDRPVADQLGIRNGHGAEKMLAGQYDFGTRFAGRAIEEFAYAFNGPVVMVGPDRPSQFLVNPSAALLSLQLHLDQGGWAVVKPGAPVSATR